MFIDLRERGKGDWEERNTNGRAKHELAASHMHSNQGLNPQPFGVCDNAPTN